MKRLIARSCINHTDADDVTERLHLPRGRCGNDQHADLRSPEVGHMLAVLPQR
ncbi:MAG: hypothetical protein J0M00_06480 [Burkholderiales bacterium]|nr:hypothetical protein [Burkholderiales bacterium]